MYTPGVPPQDLERLSGYLMEELLQISAALRMVEEGRFLPLLAVAPGKPREGMLAVADGVNWNPGSGKGLYEFRSGSWAKL